MKIRLMMFALLGFAAVGCGSVGEDGTTYAWETTTTAFDIDEVVLDTVWSEQSLSERRACAFAGHLPLQSDACVGSGSEAGSVVVVDAGSS